MKTLAKLTGLFLMVALTSLAYAGRTGGSTTTTTTTTGAFDFTYTVSNPLGTVHAYGLACQVGSTTQPKGTILLGQNWVWDLGPVKGTAKVTCPKPIVPKGTVSSVLGRLFFADSRDAGSSTYNYPRAEVCIFNTKYYNGNACIEVISGSADNVLYFAARFTPFAWDLSPYL